MKRSPYTTQGEEKELKASKWFHILIKGESTLLYLVSYFSGSMSCFISGIVRIYFLVSVPFVQLNFCLIWGSAYRGSYPSSDISQRFPLRANRQDGLPDQSPLLSPNSCNLTKIKEERKLTLVPVLFRNCWATSFDEGLSHLHNISCCTTQVATCLTWKALKWTVLDNFPNQP